MMNSRLISTVFDDPEAEHAKAFSRHLRETLELGAEDRDVCLKHLPKIKMVQVPAERRILVDELASARNLPQHAVEHALSVANFLADALLSDEIPSEDRDSWGNDFQELGWIDGQTRPAFDAMLSDLVSIRDELHFQQRQRRTAGGVFPNLTSFGCTVEIRPIRKRTFRWGERIDDYDPEILGTVSVASIHVGVDEGLVKDIYFQAEESDIDRMIESMIAAKREMAALREHLQLDDERREKSDDS